jgi:hypothetical protein
MSSPPFKKGVFFPSSAKAYFLLQTAFIFLASDSTVAMKASSELRPPGTASAINWAIILDFSRSPCPAQHYSLSSVFLLLETPRLVREISLQTLIVLDETLLLFRELGRRFSLQTQIACEETPLLLRALGQEAIP